MKQEGKGFFDVIGGTKEERLNEKLVQKPLKKQTKMQKPGCCGTSKKATPTEKEAKSPPIKNVEEEQERLAHQLTVDFYRQSSVKVIVENSQEDQEDQVQRIMPTNSAESFSFKMNDSNIEVLDR